MRRVLLLAACLLLSCGSQAADLDGKQLFHQKCGMCHGAVGMGTGLLARRMKPEAAPLETREDLSAPFVERAARIGIINMPPITRADVSDAQLTSIAQYLAKGKPSK
ncbi:MAG: cytochrome c [Steroidobacteraceae bacterium]